MARATLLERIDARRDMSGGASACWPRVRGSERITIGPGKASTEIRRAVWLLEHGSMPPRYQHIEVTCGNQKCLNPAHLVHLTEAERFWKFVDRSGGPNACWPWTSTTLRGYGRFQRGDHPWGKRFAHRYAYELTYGTIPESETEFVVMHTCDNPPCCNPRHLRLGTDRDNIHDCIAKGRNSRGEKHAAAMRAARARRSEQAPCAAGGEKR